MSNKNLYYTLEVPKNNKDPSITKAYLVENLFDKIKTHSNILHSSFLERDGWLTGLCHFLSDEDKKNRRNI